MWYSVVKSWSNQRRGEESLRLIIPARRVQVPRYIYTYQYIYIPYLSVYPASEYNTRTRRSVVYIMIILYYIQITDAWLCVAIICDLVYHIQMTRTMVLRDSCVIAGFDDGSLISSGGHVFAAASHVTWCVPEI